MHFRCPICKEGRIPSHADDEPVATLLDLTIGRGSSGTLVDEDPSGSAAPVEAASARQEAVAAWPLMLKRRGRRRGTARGRKGMSRRMGWK